MSTHVVVGATGKTGRRLCRALVQAGEHVRALGRDRRRLDALAALGAESGTVEVTDAPGLAAALEGAVSAFVMVPTGPAVENVRELHERIGDALATAIETAAVPHVVMMSACGIHGVAGRGLMPGLHGVERRLSAIPGVNLALLRPAFFMDNFYVCMEEIRRTGALGFVIGPHRPLPMIATRDIADVAARLMLRRDFHGPRAYELLGPRDYTMTEATRALAASIGIPALRYRQHTDAEARDMLARFGYVPRRADYLLAIFRGFDRGLLVPECPRTTASSTPTTMETFAAEEFAPAYAVAS
jgi:uncharacterized protein YbjT (DUF2867 family)